MTYHLVSQYFRSGMTTLLATVTGILAMQVPVLAQNILQRQGALEPLRDEYTFEGQAGQAVTIVMESTEFDTVVSLLGPDGTELEMNDDYSGSTNSIIVLTLPTAGKYTVVASSFSALGGSYNVLVRSASEYELVYDRALELMRSEDFADAIEAYTAAISLNPSEPNVYLGRADAYWGSAYLTLGENFQGPNSLPVGTRDAILADYEKAASLFEQQGDVELATSIREQAQYVRTGDTP